MQYIIRNLSLYQDIRCGISRDDGSGILFTCTSSVTKKNLDPVKEECLSFCSSSGSESAVIPAGKYLFLQGYLPAGIDAFSPEGKPAQEIYDAALQFWLEFVWREIDYADSTIYVRTLLPEDMQDMTEEQKKTAGRVFQLFRRTV